MQTQDFLKELESAYLAEFPESFISIEKKRGLYHSIFVICHLGKPEEWENKIRQNDPLSIMLEIDLTTGEFCKDHNDDSIMPDNLRLQFHHSDFKIKPDSPYLYCQHAKIKGRKTTGDPVKILAYLDKYFKQARESMIQAVESDNVLEKDSAFYRAKLGMMESENV